MEEKNREIWIGEERLYFGENDIIYVTAIGNPDEKHALAEKEAILKFMNKVEGPMHCIVDLNKAGRPSPAARKIYKDLVEHEKLGKFSLFGMHPVARVLASFVMGVSKKEDMRFFKTKEEALEWLKESKRDK